MLRWLQFGDLHACESDGWNSLGLFERMVAQVNDNLQGRVDFAVLPGDNANHATAEQFRKISAIASNLRVPLHVLPGDHDFEAGHLDDFRQLLAPTTLPRVETVGDADVILLDIVSAGSGGPDFRLGRAQGAWLRKTLQDAVRPVVVFMHAFPGDLKDGADETARLFADAGVAYVGTGHTHYNDVLNDGYVIYAATRSTGEIEEGPAGYSLSALDRDVISWRFKDLDSSWPFVLITSPSDLRMVTNVQSRTHVPENHVALRAEVFGAGQGVRVTATLDGGRQAPMEAGTDGTWSCDFADVSDGLHELCVTAVSEQGTDSDTVEVLVRNARDRPKRGAAIALGRDIHSVRTWPSHGILGGRLGPNANGRKW